ncbi:MAG: radical SAM protein [Anaerolineae bacterium]|nr:radical SAM protein [Anaerolineae bacterium]
MRAPLRTDGHLRLASVEITRRCNNDCIYCDQPKADQDLPPDQFATLLDELIAEGFEAVALGGGEPTLHHALPTLLEMARQGGLQVGLTTNSRDPQLVASLADRDLLTSFGVSAGKGEWQALVIHPRAVVNLLLLRDNLSQVLKWAVEAFQFGAHHLLLLGYKGSDAALRPTTDELSNAFSLLTDMGHRTGVAIAADDYTRRRLGLVETCGEGFLRVNLDGSRDSCCFPACEYRLH